MRRTLLALAVASSLMLGPAQAKAGGAQTCRGTRVALAVGNAAYPGMPDGGERQSAGAVASELERLGFATVLRQDLDGKNLRGAVATFVHEVSPDTVAFLFFAGVTVQAHGHGYLLPTDAAISTETDVEQAGIGLDRIVSDLTARGARLKVVVVDGARRNPFEERFRPGASKGLPPVAGSAGTLALYSSLPGTAYEDDPDRKEAFAQALVTAMDAPGAMAEEAIRRAKAAAERAFHGSRTPWVSSFLDEDVELSAKGCVPTLRAEAPAAPDPAPALPARVLARPVTPSPSAAAAPAPEPPAVVAPPDAPAPVTAAAAPQAPEPPPAATSHEPRRADAAAAPDQATAEPPSTTNRSDARLEQPPTPSPPPAPPVSATPPAETAALEPPVDDTVTDPDHLKEIADRLVDQGFDPGPANASGLASAIRAFERRAMLPSDGRASVKLLERLRSTPPPARWGAIAFGPKIGKWGMAWDSRTRREALAQAGARCAVAGCTAVASFHDGGCGALAISTRSFAIAWQDGLQQARDDATAKCDRQGSGCHVLASVCADGSGRTQVMTNDQQTR